MEHALRARAVADVDGYTKVVSRELSVADREASTAFFLERERRMRAPFERRPVQLTEFEPDVDERWFDENGRRFPPSIFVANERRKERVAVFECSPYLVPIFLRANGGNSASSTIEQARIFRVWQQKYGAQLVFTDANLMEFEIRQPPTSRDDLDALAWQHYLFDPDLGFRFEEHALGARTWDTLLRAARRRRWFFFWD